MTSSITRLARCVGQFLILIGIDPRKCVALRYVPKYLSDMRAFRRAGGKIKQLYPSLSEFGDQAGIGRGHYFHQDILVATLIYEANPERHIDIGSRLDGFIAHVASFRDIEVLDIRPLTNVGHDRIKFRQGNLMEFDDSLIEITDSLSCLHALEHFGLGRYGDPIDPEGHVKGFSHLCRMLKPNGILYLSVPIGAGGVYFNAHRVFEPSEIPEMARGILELIRYDYVDDDGCLYRNCFVDETPSLEYGCGIYCFRKT